MAKLGSLFDGAGTCPLAASILGMTPVWASEIEPFPIAVTRARFPQMLHLGDISKLNGAEIEPVDIITGGFPCQDVSVAGTREGLVGARSGLFFEATRIIQEMLDATNGEYPKYVIIENVPGLLSSNKGKDIEVVLDTMQEMGFVIDMNILDAQYMGVPQRRKRVFIVCVSANFILKQRTAFSGNIIAQCLTKILQDILGAHLKASGAEELNLGWPDRLKDGLQRKMNLFELTSAENLLTLHQNWEETIRKLRTEQEDSDLSFSESTTTSKVEGTLLNASQTETERESQSLGTLKLWRNLWEEISWVKSLSITSTVPSETTNQAIYTCALINLAMARHIVQLRNFCPTYLETGTSILTVMKECINYAEQTSSNLFSGMERIQRWDDYINAASSCREQLEQYIGAGSGQEVLSFSKGLSRDFAESEKQGQGTAENIKRSAGKSNVAYALENYPIDGRCKIQTDGKVQTLTSRMGTGGNNTPLILDPYTKTTGFAICSDKSNSMLSPNPHSGLYEATTTRTLDGNGGNPACHQGGMMVVALNTIDRHTVATLPSYGFERVAGANAKFPPVIGEELQPTLTSRGPGIVAHGQGEYIVRRLTPTECARLQGMPDWWCDNVDIKSPTKEDIAFWAGVRETHRKIMGTSGRPKSRKQLTMWLQNPRSDAAEYKMWGNGMALPCVMYVMEGIVKAFNEEV